MDSKHHLLLVGQQPNLVVNHAHCSNTLEICQSSKPETSISSIIYITWACILVVYTYSIFFYLLIERIFLLLVLVGEVNIKSLRGKLECLTAKTDISISIQHKPRAACKDQHVHSDVKLTTSQQQRTTDVSVKSAHQLLSGEHTIKSLPLNNMGSWTA